MDKLTTSSPKSTGKNAVTTAQTFSFTEPLAGQAQVKQIFFCGKNGTLRGWIREGIW
jgi:hypothetical protein